MSLGASTTNPLPQGYAVTVGTVNQLALPYNGTRGGLIFFNNSAGGTISVCPASMITIPQGTPPATPGQASAFGTFTAAQGVAGTNAPGSVTLSPGQSFIVDNMNPTTAWNAIASAPGAALTALEF